MIGLPPTLGETRVIRLLDGLVAAWLLLWIGLGFLAYRYVSGLASLSDTVVLAGRAVDATASALDAAAQIPFVGGGLADALGTAHEAARSALESGESSRRDVHDLAVLLWVVVAAAPTAPLLVLYALLRRGWQVDRRSLAEAIAGAHDEPALERFLARRALEHLPYRRLRKVSETPWLDYEEGRTAALADAELARVGLRRRPGGATRP